jgi:hypothetical protein
MLGIQLCQAQIHVLTGSIATMKCTMRRLTILKIVLWTDFSHESMSRVVKMTFAFRYCSRSSSTWYVFNSLEVLSID